MYAKYQAFFELEQTAVALHHRSGPTLTLLYEDGSMLVLVLALLYKQCVNAKDSYEPAPVACCRGGHDRPPIEEFQA